MSRNGGTGLASNGLALVLVPCAIAGLETAHTGNFSYTKCIHDLTTPTNYKVKVHRLVYPRKAA